VPLTTGPEEGHGVGQPTDEFTGKRGDRRVISAEIPVDHGSVGPTSWGVACPVQRGLAARTGQGAAPNRSGREGAADVEPW